MMKSYKYMTWSTDHVVAKSIFQIPSEPRAVFGRAHTRDIRRIELVCSYVEKRWNKAMLYRLPS